MKLAHVPRLVSGRHSHRHLMLQRELICRIDVGGRREPPTHPNAASLVVAHVLRHRSAARSLPALAKKNLSFAIADGAEPWRGAPVPGFFPPKFCKPLKALDDVGDVKYWC